MNANVRFSSIFTSLITRKLQRCQVLMPMSLSNTSYCHFVLYTSRFCKSSAFDAKKTSTFLSIMQEIFSRDTALGTTVKSSSDSFAYLQMLLLRHSIDDSPKRYQSLCGNMYWVWIITASDLLGSVLVFEGPDAGKIFDFVATR
jgi:hypothetical protein